MINYSEVEQEILEKLSVLNIENISQVVLLPEVQSEYDKSYKNARITVAYNSSDYGDQNELRVTDIMGQEEKMNFEIVFSAKLLRGDGGLHSLISKVKAILLGFAPLNCFKMYLTKTAFGQFNEKDNVWTYSMMFQTGTVVVENTLDPDPDLPLLQQGFFSEDFVSGNTPIPLPDIPTATVIDSDGSTIHSVLAGQTFACSIVQQPEPVNGRNSNNSFTFQAQSGETVHLDDIGVTLADGVHRFPSNIDIDLHQYGEVQADPGSQTRHPVVEITDPDTEMIWFDASPSTSVGNRFLMKVLNAGSYDSDASFQIDSSKDFSLQFKLNNDANFSFVGFSLINKDSSYDSIDFAVRPEYAEMSFWAGKNRLGSVGNLLNYDSMIEIRVVSGFVSVWQNLTQIYTFPKSLPQVHGYLTFDCSMYYVWSKVYDIQVVRL